MCTYLIEHLTEASKKNLLKVLEVIEQAYRTSSGGTFTAIFPKIGNPVFKDAPFRVLEDPATTAALNTLNKAGVFYCMGEAWYSEELERTTCEIALNAENFSAQGSTYPLARRFLCSFANGTIFINDNRFHRPRKGGSFYKIAEYLFKNPNRDISLNEIESNCGKLQDGDSLPRIKEKLGFTGVLSIFMEASADVIKLNNHVTGEDLRKANIAPEQVYRAIKKKKCHK